MNAFPCGWKADRLKDVCSVNVASLPASTDPDFEFPYLEISNVNYFGIVDPGAIEYLRFEAAPSRARRVVFLNCTIVASVRPNLQAVAFFSQDPKGLICSTGFNVVRPDEKSLWPKFAYYFLISDYARQYFEATATGVGYPAVADKDFGTLTLPLPELDEQRLIAEYLDRTCTLVDSVATLYADVEHGTRTKGILNRQMETMLAYRKSLIHECVTGQRRISEADVRRASACPETAGPLLSARTL